MHDTFFVRLNIFDIPLWVTLGEEYSSWKYAIWSSHFCLLFNAFLLLDLLDSAQHFAPQAFS